MACQCTTPASNLLRARRVGFKLRENRVFSGLASIHYLLLWPSRDERIHVELLSTKCASVCIILTAAHLNLPVQDRMSLSPSQSRHYSVSVQYSPMTGGTVCGTPLRYRSGNEREQRRPHGRSRMFAYLRVVPRAMVGTLAYQEHPGHGESGTMWSSPSISKLETRLRASTLNSPG